MAAIANRIVIGDGTRFPVMTFENPEIKEVCSDTAVSLIGEELYIDQFVPTVEYEVILPQIIKPTNTPDFRAKLGDADGGKILCSTYNQDLRLLPYGSKIVFYSNDQIVGVYYCKKVERLGRTDFKINAMSAIGLMDRQYHTGRVYNGQTFKTVLQEIIGTSGNPYTYTIDSSKGLPNLKVYGWLPYDTKRKNLYQLIMAYGVVIQKNSQGNMYFTYLKDSVPEEIESGRVFSGGSVSYDEPATRIEVSEHSFSYNSDMEEESVFDNSSDTPLLAGTRIFFDKPVYPSSVYCSEGDIVIEHIGDNYADIHGQGILMGKPYVHLVNVLAKDNQFADDNYPDENVVKVEDATLVTLANSQNVLNRLAQYYFHATTVKQDIRHENEKSGYRYRTINVFGETVTGFISKMSSRVSSFRRASCEIIQGYTPVGAGNTYNNCDILRLDNVSSGTWPVTSGTWDAIMAKDIPSIRVVVIGDGSPGANGADGEEGGSMYDPSPDVPPFTRRCAPGGTGGAGGAGGAGGRIYQVDLDCTGLRDKNFTYGRNSSYVYFQSAWDSGSTCNFKSSSGQSSVFGFYEPFGRVIYARPGKDGIAGGAGGTGGQYPQFGQHAEGTPGEDILDDKGNVLWHGGVVGNNGNYQASSGVIPGGNECRVAAGGGGGAAYGRNGGASTGVVLPAPDTAASFNRYVGQGGNGANAINPSATRSAPGSGGNGGHGGGGGGGQGQKCYYNPDENVERGFDGGWIGFKGTGSSGTAGKPGCVIVYY